MRALALVSRGLQMAPRRTSQVELFSRRVKKSLATPAGVVTRGVILRALRGYMRKFKRFPQRSLRFRSLLILTGALVLLAAFTPRANADVIAYFNFEDATNGGPPDFTSEADQGLGVATTITTNYNPAQMETVADFAQGLNRLAADTDNPPFGLHSLGLNHTSPNNGAFFDIPLFSAQGIFQDMTVTFAYNCAGNGFTTATLFFSTNGGATFTMGPSATLLTSGTNALATLVVPAAANNAPLLVLRIVFTGGTSNGNNNETLIDNLLIGGTIVPEPATVAGGLLGVLGLCWHQRRRLIRSVRFRRASV
jgi:hypothetical protein